MWVVHSRPFMTAWPIPTRLNSGCRMFARWIGEPVNVRNSVASVEP